MRKENVLYKEKQNSMLPLCFVLYLLVCLKTHPSYQGGGGGRSGHVKKCRLIFKYGLTACSKHQKPTIKRNCPDKEDKFFIWELSVV